MGVVLREHGERVAINPLRPMTEEWTSLSTLCHDVWDEARSGKVIPTTTLIRNVIYHGMVEETKETVASIRRAITKLAELDYIIRINRDNVADGGVYGNGRHDNA